MSPNGRSLANIIWKEFILSDFRNGERKGKKGEREMGKGQFLFHIIKNRHLKGFGKTFNHDQPTWIFYIFLAYFR